MSASEPGGSSACRTLTRERGQTHPWSITDARVRLYYDPYDFEIDADPYPVWRRLRDEAPLYYNEKYDFFALSRFDDVEDGLVDWQTYSSAKGSLLELIKADIEIPPGIVHLRGPARATTCTAACCPGCSRPKKMGAIEPKVREFCAAHPRPARRRRAASTSSRDLGAQMPMRTIGMLLGIPEEDQEAIRDQIDDGPAHRGRRDARRRPATSAVEDQRRSSPTTSTGGPSTPPTT